MDPVSIVTIVSGVLALLKTAKETFFDDTTINEAEEISKRKIEDNVESLKDQVNNQRDIIEKLVEQVKSNKDRIEQNIEIMVKISEAIKQTASRLDDSERNISARVDEFIKTYDERLIDSEKKTAFTLKQLYVVSTVSLVVAICSVFVVFSK